MMAATSKKSTNSIVTQEAVRFDDWQASLDVVRTIASWCARAEEGP